MMNDSNSMMDNSSPITTSNSNQNNTFFTGMDNPIKEQEHICLTACAPSDAHLSELDDEVDSPKGYFPYSSGNSPVSSFRVAIRQSRTNSTCGKFNESLLGGLRNPEAIKSTLCVCTSIRPAATFEVGEDKDEEDEVAEQQPFPTKTQSVTEVYNVSHEVIGIGESGKVMACYQRNIEKGGKFALKVLRDSARSRREIELHWLASQHPNVVSIVDIFENTFDGLACLLFVVQFMEGGDLLTLFESNGRSPYSEQCVARIVRQIGSAVQFLHHRNIAHRDIKLENILCTFNAVDSCNFKLADFGFAKRSEPDKLMDSPCCTPAYVCPEILNRQHYDKACDIWALGVATYILLCGYPPFYSLQGLPFSPGMRERITTGLFGFPPDDWDDISKSTRQTIKSMLCTDASDRITIDKLMTSDFLSTNKINGPQLHPLPPVPSDSSISSDGDLDSTDGKSIVDSGCESQQETSSENQQKDTIKEQCHPKTHFFVGSGAKSARQIPKPVQLYRERVYSIQERVDKALALMRLGADCTNPCELQDLDTLKTNKLLERRRANNKLKSGGVTGTT